MKQTYCKFTRYRETYEIDALYSCTSRPRAQKKLDSAPGIAGPQRGVPVLAAQHVGAGDLGVRMAGGHRRGTRRRV